MIRRMINLLKLSVGSVSVEDHEDWQVSQRPHWPPGQAIHVTRMWPKREAELLDGGSLYWVIQGRIRVRQRLIGMGGEHNMVKAPPRPVRKDYIRAITAPIHPADAGIGDNSADMLRQPCHILLAAPRHRAPLRAAKKFEQPVIFTKTNESCGGIGADLRRGPLLPHRPAEGKGQHRRRELDGGDGPVDATGAGVHGGNDGLGPVPARLRGKGADEPDAEREGEREEPVAGEYSARDGLHAVRGGA